MFPMAFTNCGNNMRINCLDISETVAQRRRRVGVSRCSSNPQPPPERRSTISSPMANSLQTRMRNLSGGSSGSTASGSSCGSSTQLDNQFPDNHFFSLDIPSFSNQSVNANVRAESSSPPCRKLDRSLSDGGSTGSGSSQHRFLNASRYKTELCRPFEESGSCKYGDKCQFAHGMHELRNLDRHPKYKTELCRTFHTIGFCPYGPRCHFVHEEEKQEGSSSKVNSGSSSPSLSPTGSDTDTFSYNSNKPNTNTLTVNINNNFGTWESLEQRFNSINLNRDSRDSFSSSSRPTEENDIFSSISVFNPNEVVDNAPPSSNAYSYSKQQLDNYPAHVDTSCYWPTSRFLGHVDPFHISPTGSTGSTSSGSDSGSSDCSGSTESLPSYGVKEWNPHLPFDLMY